MHVALQGEARPINASDRTITHSTKHIQRFFRYNEQIVINRESDLIQL